MAACPQGAALSEALSNPVALHCAKVDITWFGVYLQKCEDTNAKTQEKCILVVVGSYQGWMRVSGWQHGASSSSEIIPLSHQDQNI